MTLAEVIINTAIETDDYLIDNEAILMEAARKGCLHRFDYMLENLDSKFVESLMETTISNNAVDGFVALVKNNEYGFVLETILNNDEMVRAVLNIPDFDYDETLDLLKLLANNGRWDLIKEKLDNHKFYFSDVEELSIVAYNARHRDTGDKLRKVAISLFMELANREVKPIVKKAIESNVTKVIGNFPLSFEHLNYACKIANDETVKFILFRTRHYSLIHLLFAENGRLELMKYFHERRILPPVEECKAITTNKEVLDWLNSL